MSKSPPPANDKEKEKLLPPPQPLPTPLLSTSHPPYSPSRPDPAFIYPSHYYFPPFFTIQPNPATRLSQFRSWSGLVQSYCRHHRVFRIPVIEAATSRDVAPRPKAWEENGPSGSASATSALGAQGSRPTYGPAPPPKPATEASTQASGSGSGSDAATGTDTEAPRTEKAFPFYENTGWPLFHNRLLDRRLDVHEIKEVMRWMAGEEGGRRAERLAGEKEEGDGGTYWIFWRTPEEWAGVLEEWVESTGQKGSVLTLYEIAHGDGTLSQEFHGMNSELLHRCLQILVKRGKAQIFGQKDEMGVKFF